MSEQKVDLNISKEKMTQTNISFFEKRFENFEKLLKSKFSKQDFDAISFENEGYSKSSFHNHLNLLDGNKLLKGGLIK